MKVLIISPQGELHKADSHCVSELVGLVGLGYKIISYEEGDYLQLRDGDWYDINNFRCNTEELAGKLYLRHMKDSFQDSTFSWENATEEYRQAWMTIAEAQLEGLE